MDPVKIERVFTSSVGNQPKPQPEPETVPEMIQPHPVKGESVTELHDGTLQQPKSRAPQHSLVIEQIANPEPMPPQALPVEPLETPGMPGPRPDRAQAANYTAPLPLLLPRRRESRISIGRVEVQVNNRTTSVPPNSPALVPVSGGDSLSGRHLERFALRP
jgi:hypothetical protein